MKTTRLSARLVVAATVATVASTITLVAPAQADDRAGTAMSTQVNDEYQSDSGMEVLQVARLPTGDYEVTHVPTGDTIVVDQGSASQQGIAPRPASEHHLIDGCGVDWGRPYCDLTRAAQGAIIAGTTGGVVAAICYFGGPGICIVAGAAVAAVGWYLIEYGRCPGNLRVRLNYSGNFSVWCL